MTCSKGPKGGIELEGRCSKDTVSVHGAPALPTELPWCPNLDKFNSEMKAYFSADLLKTKAKIKQTKA